MARISKENAHNAAKKIAQKIMDNKAAKQKEMSEFITDMVERSIPDPVMKLFKTHAEYLKKEKSICLNSHGFSWKYLTMTKSLPLHSQHFAITAKDAKVVVKMYNEIEDFQKNYDLTVSEIECSLLTLGTMKRVQDSFPEAIPYLPAINTSTAIALNLQPIRKTVKALVA